MPVDLMNSGLEWETIERARRNLATNRTLLKVSDRFFKLSGSVLSTPTVGARDRVQPALQERDESTELGARPSKVAARGPPDGQLG